MTARTQLIRCSPEALFPLCHLPGPLKHLMTGTYAHQLLSDLDDAVRRHAGPVA